MTKTPKPERATKSDLVRGLLAREGGASLDEICAATGWQPHSARAALTGLRKAGLVLTRQPGTGDAPTTWRIESPTPVSTAMAKRERP